MRKSILVTGGAGFIGSHFVDRLLGHPELWSNITVLDNLTYSGNLRNLEFANKYNNFFFIKGNISDKKLIKNLIQKFDIVINFAAESHVDKSIENGSIFFETNIIGTQNLLESIKNLNPTARFIQISTDEVYGSKVSGESREEDPLSPSSPYSASKAAADLIVLAYIKTYGIDAIITRTCNNYGPRQYPEKLVPLLILKSIENQDLPIYGDGKNTREWIHVYDNCEAIEKIALGENFGNIINIGSGFRLNNIEIANKILTSTRSSSKIKFVTDRKGHDFRYALSNDLMSKKILFTPKIKFEEGLKSTISWYQDNLNWFIGRDSFN